jgi:photosystem II stability/assembly factor-like uncharacterized protein
MRPLKGFFFFVTVFYVLFAASTLEAGDRTDLFITQIAVHPLQPNIVYAVTTYSTGVLKSIDGGLHWFLINQGIKSYSLYHFAVDPREINTIYLGAGGGGLYKSVDGGEHWVEMNDGFQDTDIGQMFLHPDDPGRVYVVSASGVYKSPDGGRHWEAWNQGDNFTLSQEFQNIVVLPGKPDRFYLASKQGLYTRSEGDPGWRSVSKEMEGRQISALAADPLRKRLYAAVLRDGTTLKGGGLFVSDDYGIHWKSAALGIEQDWIRVIRLDPSDPKHLYLATSNRGILSGYEGRSEWKESNNGMGPLDIRSLVIDPSNSRILFAGAHGEGIFKSTDGGETWSHPGEVPFLDSKTIIAQLTTPDPARKRPEIIPPPAFAKCNKCHGWTDPFINLVHGYWLVPPNRRNWNFTVKRMSKGAGLTPDEEKSIETFLRTYSEKYGGSP